MENKDITVSKTQEQHKVRLAVLLLILAAVWTAVWYWPHSTFFESLFNGFSPGNSYVLRIVLSFVTIAVLEIVFLLVLVKREKVKNIRQFFKIERLDIKGIWLCLGLGIFIQAINAAFLWNLVLKPARDFLASHGIGGPLIGLGTGNTVPLLSPTLALLLTGFLLIFWWIEVPEELFFRGYLQNKFQSIIGKNKAAVVSAIVWDLAHVWGLVSIVERFLYGLLYGFVFRLRQNTTPTMIVHPLGNRALLLAVVIPQIWGATVNSTSLTGIALLVGIYVALILLVILLWRVMHLDRSKIGLDVAPAGSPEKKQESY